MVWLFCPFTDGATLLYDLVTKPYIVPRIAFYHSWKSVRYLDVIDSGNHQLQSPWVSVGFLCDDARSFKTLCCRSDRYMVPFDGFYGSGCHRG